MKTEQGSSLSSAVYNKLEEEILNGVYPSGENLTEISLSQKFGVSRTPIREALRKLERNGLVRIETNKGAVVAGISEKDLKEIYTIRMYIEGLAARWAAENITEETVEKLKHSVEIMENAGEDIHAADNAFHSIIYEACNSRILKSILMDFRNYINSATRNPFKNSPRAAKAVREHKEILAAIAAGNGELAEKLAKDHVYFAYSSTVQSTGTSA